ncbi:MAG: ABC-2 family transporter protein [Verrucomicrobiota bacterium]
MQSLYTPLFKIGVQNTLIYRWNFLVRLTFSLVPLFGLVYFWKAVYASSGANIQNYAYGEMIQYFLICMVVEAFVTPTDDEWQISAEIRDGQLNMLLLRPMNHLLYRLTLFASSRLVNFSIVILPLLAVFIPFHDSISFPHQWETWVLFFFSTALSALIQFLISYSIAMLSFWILEISTVVFIFFSFEYFFSGHFFPLDLLPPIVFKWVLFTPFPYELWFPVALLQGRITGNELTQGLCIQFIWVVLLYSLAKTMWAKGLQKYGAVGG